MQACTSHESCVRHSRTDKLIDVLMFCRTHISKWARALSAAAVLMGCDGPDRVAAPDDFAMHARIDDTDHHGWGSICVPLDELGSCHLEMTFYRERLGFVAGDLTGSVVIDGDVRILAGAGPSDLVFRPGARPNAYIYVTDSGRPEFVSVSDFEITIDGSTHLVNGSITSMLAEVFDVWGEMDVACATGEPPELVTETGEVRAIRCNREW